MIMDPEKIKKIKNEKVAVLGAGRSGLAVALLLKKSGAHVLVSELRSKHCIQEAAETLYHARIHTEFDGHTDRIYDADWWVVSPGIPCTSDVLIKARQKGIQAYSELEVGSWFSQSPIIAVTGSNGKSTTTALIGHLFKTAGIPCVVAGNIGVPFSGVAEKTSKDGVVVLEVSSFQLELVQDFHPDIAVFLNLTPDHLDRHGSLEAYGRMKARIYKNQTRSDHVIFNAMDPMVVGLVNEAAGQKIAFGFEGKTMKCAYVKDENLILHLMEKAEMVCPVQQLKIPGLHNVLNALAAASTARLMGINVEAIQRGLLSFRGLPHRMEFVRNINGIDWINDSKATNVDSVWYALGSYSKPIVLIAGGRDKDSDFSVLRERVREKTKAVFLLGEAKEKIVKSFHGIDDIYEVASLDAAVEQAHTLARPGDVVLLSPACASFDMFQDFEDRGDQFKKLVNAL